MTQPSRKDIMRPYEYLAIAGGIALFSALIAFATTRDIVVTLIGAGGIFILALMTLALLALAMKPDENEIHDIEAQDHPTDEPRGH